MALASEEANYLKKKSKTPQHESCSHSASASSHVRGRDYLRNLEKREREDRGNNNNSSNLKLLQLQLQQKQQQLVKALRESDSRYRSKPGRCPSGESVFGAFPTVSIVNFVHLWPGERLPCASFPSSFPCSVTENNHRGYSI